VLSIHGADPAILSVPEAVLAVIMRIAQNDDRRKFSLLNQFSRAFYQSGAYSNPLMVGMNAQRTKGGRLDHLIVFIDDMGFRVPYATYNRTVDFSDVMQFVDAIGMPLHQVHQIVLIASRPVQIPERFSGQRFYPCVIPFFFLPDDYIH
jgi:hypothetical protein